MCFQLLVSVRTLRARCSNWQVDFANPSFATSLFLFAIYSKVTDNNVSWGPTDLDTTRVRGCTGWTASANNSWRFSPNRLTCIGFLLLSKGCIPGPHDFASVSGLASHSGCLGPHVSLHLSPPCLPPACLGPHEFTLVSPLSPPLGALGRMSLHLSPRCLPLWVPCRLVSPLSPTLGALGRMSLHLSPPFLPLWVPWAAWVYTCLPLVSHTGCLGPHEFTLLSPLSPTLGALWTCLPLVSHSRCLGPHEFTLVSPLSPTLGALARMSLHLCPPCLPLSVPWAAWVCTCLPLVSHSGCLGPHEFTLLSPLSPTLGALGRMSLHLSPPCLPLWLPWAAWVYTCLPLVSHCRCLGPHEFALVYPLFPTLGALYTCLPLVSHSGFGPHEFALVSPLSPTLGALGRMSLHLSPTCLPLWVPWAAWVYTCLPLVSHSGCLGPHEFTLVSPLSPTPGCLVHLSPPCLPHWVPWAAWVYTCLPLVSHICLPHLSPTLGSLGRMSLHLSPPLGSLGRMSLHLSAPCLPLWVPWAAWVYTCLPLVSHSGCLGPHEFPLVSHLSPTCLPLVSHLSPTCLPHLTLASHSGFLGPHEFTLVSPLSPTLGALGRMSLHLSPTLVSHTCLSHLSLTLGALGRMSLWPTSQPSEVWHM